MGGLSDNNQVNLTATCGIYYLCNGVFTKYYSRHKYTINTVYIH